LDPGRLGLALEGPFVKVNQKLETSLPGVFAIGDLVGGQMLAHKAAAEAESAVENILGHGRTVKPELVPRCIWSRPEMAAVGLTEEEAARTGRPIKVGRFTYPNSGKAQAMGELNGLVKIIAARDNGQILGVHLLGEAATEMIGEPLLAMTMESAVEDLAAVIKPHPTLSENIKEAALDWSDLAIHQPMKA
jgi:dihydrolipoamide dehydrogenase